MKYTFYCAGRLELMAYKKAFLTRKSMPFTLEDRTCYCEIINIDENNVTIKVLDDTISKILKEKLETGYKKVSSISGAGW
jgi:hypothetical protein